MKDKVPPLGEELLQLEVAKRERINPDRLPIPKVISPQYTDMWVTPSGHTHTQTEKAFTPRMDKAKFRRKRISRAGRRVEDTHVPTVRNPKNQQDSNHITYAEAVLQNPAGPVLPTLVPVRQYAPCLVDSVGSVLLVSSILCVLYCFLPLFHGVPRALQERNWWRPPI